MPCFIPPRKLQSGASFCRILPAASDAAVRRTGFTPGRFSPGARAELQRAPDAPIRGVMYLSLLADFGVCVRGALVFFLSSRAHRRCTSHAIPAPLCFPSRPFPSLSAPLSLFSCSPFTPFVAALLGHALKLLVSTRTCCYVWGGHTRSFIFLLSCLLFVLVLCSSSRPVPCRMHLALPLPTFCPLLLCLFGARTQAPTPTHAVCHHSHLSSNHSFCTLAARYVCVTTSVDTVGNAAANSPLAFEPTVSGILWCLSYSSRLGLFAFFRRPRLGVLALCIRDMLCHLFFMSWTRCFLRRPRVSVS